MKRLLPRRRRAGDPAPLTCRELVELVTDYLEGALDEQDRARFESHIAMCEGCTAYVEQMHETLRIMGSIEPESLSAEAQQDLLEAFRGWKAGGGAT